MTNTIWSVNILLGIGLIGVLYVIYNIFKLSNEEMRDVSIQDKKNQQNH